MATLNKHAARPVVDTAHVDGDSQTTELPVRRAHRASRRRVRAPRSCVAYALGTAIVCTVALFDLMGGEPATASPEQSESVAVAAALGIDGTGAEAGEPPVENPVLLEQLAASRAQRDASQAAAAASQAQAEQAAKDRAEAEARAAAEAAARAEAEAAAKAAEDAGSASTATAAAGTTVSAVANISNSAGPVRPQAQAAADAVVSNVPGAAGITIGGTRPSAADPGGHPSGLALDYMVGVSNVDLGNAIVAYHIANWDALGVEYVIYRQRILQSPGGSWQQMEDRGDPTQNHMDHPHVNYLG